jgi:GR25 family glycosyltransferase involved in LPS biosynthesis
LPFHCYVSASEALYFLDATQLLVSSAYVVTSGLKSAFYTIYENGEAYVAQVFVVSKWFSVIMPCDLLTFCLIVAFTTNTVKNVTLEMNIIRYIQMVSISNTSTAYCT